VSILLRVFLTLFFYASIASAQSLPWHKAGKVGGLTGSYTPVVIMGGNQVRIFRNSAQSGFSDLLMHVGSWSKIGGASRVLHITDPRDDWIRTSGIVRGVSGTYYAVLYTGDNYPTQGGYSPSWATSPDGYAWTWHGPISPFGRNQSSAMNLVVDESRTDAYRFMFWMDIPAGIMLVHSADGATWQSDGLDVWPLDEVPQFLGGVKTPYAYHLMGVEWTNGNLRHVISCDGLTNWRMVEMASIVGVNGVKGANLAYDPVTNTLHALASDTHWTLPEYDWGC
jgi:hypothetical protein